MFAVLCENFTTCIDENQYLVRLSLPKSKKMTIISSLLCAYV
jgi:hypothetical protein